MCSTVALLLFRCIIKSVWEIGFIVTVAVIGMGIAYTETTPTTTTTVLMTGIGKHVAWSFSNAVMSFLPREQETATQQKAREAGERVNPEPLRPSWLPGRG